MQPPPSLLLQGPGSVACCRVKGGRVYSFLLFPRPSLASVRTSCLLLADSASFCQQSQSLLALGAGLWTLPSFLPPVCLLLSAPCGAPPGPAPQLCPSSLLCGRNCPFLSSAFRVSPGALHPPAQQPPSQQCTRSSNRSAAQLSHSSGERRRNWRSEGLGSHLHSLRCISPIILSPQHAAQRFLATCPAPPVPGPR